MENKLQMTKGATMNELQIFNNNQFGEMRTIEEGDKIFFCGADVAKALGYTNSSKALTDHCRCVTKRYIPHPQAPDKEIEMSFIPEGDVYRLITHSKLPTAEKFESWVFDEVLPTIRKHGAYLTPEALERAMNDPDFTIGLLTALKNERESRQIAETKVSMLSAEVLTWADRKVLNAIMRKYSSQVYNADFAKGWNAFYKELLYKHEINLKSRATQRMNRTGKKLSYLDTLADAELPAAISTAVAMCHEQDVNIDDIIQNVA
jgi:prophage antirepressor-like protein